MTTDVLLRTLTFLPALLAGVWLGARSFKNADPIFFRKCVLGLLIVLAAMSVVKGVAAVLVVD